VRKAELAFWNANGVRRKKLEVENYLSEHGIDTCLLSEAHL